MQYLELYQNYLKVENPKKEGFTSVHCPFHDDNGKSAGIDLSTGVFKCLKCDINCSSTRFVSKITDKPMAESSVIVETYRAEKKIHKNESNFSKKFIFSLERPDWRELYLESKRTKLKETFATEYCQSRDISIETLEGCDIGFLKKEHLPQKQQYLGDVLTFPYFYGGKVVGIRFRNEEGSKSGLEGSIAVPWGIDDLTPDDDFAIFMEGESDKLRVFHELSQRGLKIPVLSLPGSFWRTEWERDLSGLNNIFFVPDTDEAGEKAVGFAQKVYGEKIKVHKLDWKPRQLGKDFCEWIAQNTGDIPQFIEEILNHKKISKTYGALQTTSSFLVEDADEEKKDEYIKGFLYAGQVGVIGGKMKSKKTWVSLNLLRTLTTPGEKFLTIPSLISCENSPTILYVQNEGSKKKFRERVKMVLAGAKNPDNIYWLFKPGYKLDKPEDVKKLAARIEQSKAQILLLDPFQKMHNKNEDSATEMGFVWEGIFNIMSRFPNLAIIIIHHFGKEGSITEGFDALRGSSRMGGEVDFGLFVEKSTNKSVNGIRISFVFRDEEDLTNDNGENVFKLEFGEDGIFRQNEIEQESTKSKQAALEQEVLRRKEWKMVDAQEFFKVSAPTIKKWVDSSNKITRTSPGPNSPVLLIPK